MNPRLLDVFEALELSPSTPARRELLAQLAAYVRARRAAGELAQLVFICTHNSRRSLMGQLWAAAAAEYCAVGQVACYSGGTEATAFAPPAVAAMRRAGFAIVALDGEGRETNPRYQVSVAEDRPPMLAWSKTWDDPANPREGFAAVMTCSQADEACPLIHGAAVRIALPYDDPKVADGTPEEAQRYDQRAKQIAAEMLYVFHLVAGK